VFLEDYDINVARYLVQGVDVWLNTPRRPQEASGTSGMKAAANGGLNVSILDGWWCEGYAPGTGWVIGSGEVYEDAEEQDQVECEALYNLLENEIIPLFYERDKGGLPRGWIGMMKTSMRKLGATFNTARMVQEYTERFYLPAHRAGIRLAKDGFASAKELSAWRSRVAAEWSRVSMRVDGAKPAGDLLVGSRVAVTIRASLGGLSAGDIAVEVYYGMLDTAGEVQNGEIVRARHEGREGNEEIFRAEIPCKVSGRFGFAARILPRNPDVVNPLTPLLLTWE
jgi:starch phosphorylase